MNQQSSHNSLLGVPVEVGFNPGILARLRPIPAGRLPLQPRVALHLGAISIQISKTTISRRLGLGLLIANGKIP